MDRYMHTRWKKIIASMLTTTMILSNSNIVVFAEETNTEETNTEETITVGADQKTTENTSGPESTEEETEALSEKVQIAPQLVEEDETAKAGETKKEIQTVQDLVDLSKAAPESYQNAEIILAPHDIGELDLSGTEFAGLGSDEYPFKGSISFSGEYTGYITLDKSLFNAVSGDARISELNLKTANNMTDPILAKNYVKGEQTDPTTIRLKIDAKSTEITEGGGQTSYSSFGGVIGTLG